MDSAIFSLSFFLIKHLLVVFATKGWEFVENELPPFSHIFSHKGTFNDYVDTIFPLFDHHLPQRGHFQPWTCTKIEICWTTPTNSSCLSSHWRPPRENKKLSNFSRLQFLQDKIDPNTNFVKLTRIKWLVWIIVNFIIQELKYCKIAELFLWVSFSHLRKSERVERFYFHKISDKN